MCSSARKVWLYLNLWALVCSFAFASNDTITCYGVNGLAYPNQIQCPNSHACCGAGDGTQCLDNRLCQETDGTLIRGPCSDSVYDVAECAQICVYNETLQANFFPRVTQCSDGSLCCNYYQPSNCCATGLGVFVDNKGVITNGSGQSSLPAATSTSTTMTTTTAVPAATEVMSSSISEDTSTSTPQVANNGSGGDSTTPFKVGIGVGIGLGVPLVAILGGICTCIFLQKKNSRRRNANRGRSPGLHYGNEYGNATTEYMKFSEPELPLVELAGNPKNWKQLEMQLPPAELAGH